MKRRDLLRSFPAAGIAFLFGRPAKAEPTPESKKEPLGPNWPDEDFLRALLADIERIVGYPSSLAYCGVKADNTVYLRDEYNRTVLARNEVGLCAHFDRDDSNNGIYVSLSYTWNTGSSLIVIAHQDNKDDVDREYDLPEDLNEVREFVLAKVHQHKPKRRRRK